MCICKIFFLTCGKFAGDLWGWVGGRAGEGSHSTGGLQDPRCWFFYVDKTIENCVEKTDT